MQVVFQLGALLTIQLAGYELLGLQRPPVDVSSSQWMDRKIISTVIFNTFVFLQVSETGRAFVHSGMEQCLLYSGRKKIRPCLIVFQFFKFSSIASPQFSTFFFLGAGKFIIDFFFLSFFFLKNSFEIPIESPLNLPFSSSLRSFYFSLSSLLLAVLL